MLTATREAAKKNSKFLLVGMCVAALYGSVLWVGPRAERLLAPITQGWTYSNGELTAEKLRPDCQFRYLHATSVDPDGWAFVNSHTVLDNRLATVIGVSLDSGERVLPGAYAVFRCPWQPWESRVPVRSSVWPRPRASDARTGDQAAQSYSALQIGAAQLPLH